MTEPFGSPYYIAPEVIRGCYTQKCDIWSIGVILHILIIGVPPFVNDDNKKLLHIIKTATQIGFENRLWKARSIGCIDLVKKLMDCNFTQRSTAELAMTHEWLEKFSHFNVDKADIKQCLLNFK